MNRAHWLISGLLLAVLSACGGGSGGSSDSDVHSPLAFGDNHKQALAAPRSAAAAPDIVVMLAKDGDITAVARHYRASVVSRFGQRPIYRLRLAATASVSATLAAMQTDPQVRFAEANVESQTPEGRQQVVWAVGGNSQSYTQQWAPAALALPQAHALSVGAGVRVAVLDTGADLAHPALAARWARDAAGAVLGFDFVDNDRTPAEAGSPAAPGWGHGTHVAGLVALAAPGARLMPVRVLDDSGRGNAWVLAEALLWAIDPDGNPATDDGARIVNLSLGTVVPTRLLNTAIELATCSDDDDSEAEDDTSDPGFDADRERCNLRPGVVVLAAAGNSGSATERQYPAAEGAEGQLAITATRPGSRLASFANFGDWVQLAAPGAGLVSTMPGGGYATWSGTSMAAPLAAGVAALVLAQNPDWKPVDVSKRLQDRSVKLCGTPLRGLHALGAVADFVPGDPYCP